MIVLREVALNAQRERRHVAGRGDLLAVGQAGGVAKPRARHAEIACRAGHPLGEGVFCLADVFRDGRRDIVRRLDHEGLDGVLDADRRAGLQTQLRRLHAGGMLGNHEATVEFHPPGTQLLEQNVKRHHLGERGRIAVRIGFAGEQDPTGFRIDGDCGESGLRCRRRAVHAREGKQYPHQNRHKPVRESPVRHEDPPTFARPALIGSARLSYPTPAQHFCDRPPSWTGRASRFGTVQCTPCRPYHLDPASLLKRKYVRFLRKMPHCGHNAALQNKFLTFVVRCTYKRHRTTGHRNAEITHVQGF